MQDIWGDKWNDNQNHGFHINISQKISKFFGELWNDENIPQEYKLTLGIEQCLKVIRLPWFNVAILNGSIISLNQLDDILDATKISNEEYDKKIEEINKEFAKNPTTNDKPYGKILSYYKDASQKLTVTNEKGWGGEDCKK